MCRTHRGTTRTLRLFAVLVGMFIACLPLGQARADDPVKITVKILDNAFDPALVEVTQGQAVELTFVWAQTRYLDDEHIIVVEGYKVETDKLDRNHTSSTVKFIASKVGTFNFACDTECEAHDSLQQGAIKVKAAAGGATASALTPTRILIDPVANVSVRVDRVALLATLVDKDGQPVKKADVNFFVEQKFAGKTGLMEIGSARTGPAGTAQVVYHPTRTDDEKVVVRFEAQGIYDGAETTITLPGNRLFGPAPDDTDGSLDGLKLGGRGGFAAVILAVWALLVYVAYQAWQITRAGKGGPA